ncbi:Elf1-domain-containing protein [Sistotremastrum niveocremeum HHB9708]|uniref:Transcription elongation factor 1 homolog n=2 Tax=Sistotremastraceae TaxID=3402574 RepID=A0A165ALT2_9AGAM|nr:Elf1-domain-containing protein [Sistotremastrum niveocremeum HHB9708]KZT42064.1 Elf1-domain-containing protein [Sistotremastrum suecicum HHB10207 ss-3]
MGKRKKSSRKPQASRRKEPLETSFTCLFCHHDKSVSVKIDRKEGTGFLSCKVCGQTYQSKINHLTEPVDVFAEWMDAADNVNAETEAREKEQYRSAPSASRSHAIARDESDDEE